MCNISSESKIVLVHLPTFTNSVLDIKGVPSKLIEPPGVFSHRCTSLLKLNEFLLHLEFVTIRNVVSKKESHEVVQFREMLFRVMWDYPFELKVVLVVVDPFVHFATYASSIVASHVSVVHVAARLASFTDVVGFVVLVELAKLASFGSMCLH
ncbi:hypothetical protein A2U01_0011888 [Trifolium medium]|uniref:Uncharacterized protein n=1 Tax=Trifolium medium TaxID=97028 RepID=A0A392MXH2_9FABA|nr:hypothetical protein [Trifolium medium]